MPSDETPTIPPQVLDLVERFERNRDAYKTGSDNETQVRREFIDPFFKALGWDIEHEQGYAEAYKDVITRTPSKVSEPTKAPDYCFRIGGTRKFFLEARIAKAVGAGCPAGGRQCVSPDPETGRASGVTGK